MLNIQYGNKEFNLPYALTKSIGEVWLVVITVQTGFFLFNILLMIHYINNTLHSLLIAHCMCMYLQYFSSFLSIICVRNPVVCVLCNHCCTHSQCKIPKGPKYDFKFHRGLLCWTVKCRFWNYIYCHPCHPEISFLSSLMASQESGLKLRAPVLAASIGMHCNLSLTCSVQQIHN